MDIAVKDYLISLVDEIISNFIYPLNIKVEKEIQEYKTFLSKIKGDRDKSRKKSKQDRKTLQEERNKLNN